MSQSIVVAAAVVIAKPRLRAFLRAPVVPASAWTEGEWIGVCEAWSDSGVRRRYREELAGAIDECDGWLDGDYAGLLRGLDDEGSPAIAFDEVTGSLVVDFEARVDFELPSLIWAFSVLRGMESFLDEGDGGLVTVTVDWSGDSALMLLASNRSSFLDRTGDAVSRARARNAEFDVRCAVSDGEGDGASVAETVDRLLRS
ncbi:hypothetical protein [Kitasatospora sp. NPDC088346]|uniref:hypothetical protein n=1 Tax=Kitasatospora sp. NPDC088346 TaxID=3364073 RepID=UPI00381EB55C